MINENMKVLITDYAWADLDEERAIFDGVGASMVIATTGDEPELVQLAADVDGILTCWKPVTANVLRGAPRCVAVGRYGIGLDNIDVASASSLAKNPPVDTPRYKQVTRPTEGSSNGSTRRVRQSGETRASLSATTM